IEGCVVAHHDGATTTAGAGAAPTGEVRTRCWDGGEGYGASGGEGTHTRRAAVDSGRRRRHGAGAPGSYCQPVGRCGRSTALGWLLCRPAAAKHACAHHTDRPARPSHATLQAWKLGIGYAAAQAGSAAGRGRGTARRLVVSVRKPTEQLVPGRVVLEKERNNLSRNVRRRAVDQPSQVRGERHARHAGILGDLAKRG